MPHVFLEYTDNVKMPESQQALLAELNQSLAECATFEVERIKSRATALMHYCMGDGTPGKGFVYLHLAIAPGRKESLKMRIQEHMLKFLKQKIASINPELTIHFSVHLIDLNDYLFVVKEA